MTPTQYGYKQASTYVRPHRLRLVEQHVWQQVLLLAAGSTGINGLFTALRDIFDTVGGRQLCEMEQSTFFLLLVVLSPPHTFSGGGTVGVHIQPIDSHAAGATADLSPDNQMQVDDPNPAPVYPDTDNSVDGFAQPENTGTDLHEPNPAAKAQPSLPTPQAPGPRVRWELFLHPLQCTSRPPSFPPGSVRGSSQKMLTGL